MHTFSTGLLFISRFFAVMPHKFHRVLRKGYSKTKSAVAKPVKVIDQIESSDDDEMVSVATNNGNPTIQATYEVSTQTEMSIFHTNDFVTQTDFSMFYLIEVSTQTEITTFPSMTDLAIQTGNSVNPNDF